MEETFLGLFLIIGLIMGFIVGLNFGLKRGMITEGIKSSKVFTVLKSKIELLEKQNEQLRKGN